MEFIGIGMLLAIGWGIISFISHMAGVVLVTAAQVQADKDKK